LHSAAALPASKFHAPVDLDGASTRVPLPPNICQDCLPKSGEEATNQSDAHFVHLSANVGYCQNVPS